VIDRVTGASVRDARVAYEHNGKSSGGVVSDAGGFFRFRDLPSGTYSFLVSAKDYEPRFHVGTVILRPGQTVSDVSLRLLPFSSLSGQITDDDGKPLAGIEVEMWRVSYLTGIRGLRAESPWTYTDRQGFYRFPSMAPGRYYVSASATAEKLADASETEQERYVRRFYPGILDPEAAASVDLSPGVDLSTIDFRLSKTTGVTVRGEVRSSSIAEITLVPETFQFNSSFSAKTSLPDGKFEIRGVLPGLYTIKAHIKTDGAEEWAVSSVAVGTGGVEGLDLQPVPAPSFTGHIRVDGPVEGTDLSTLVIELRPADRASGNIMFTERASREGMVRIANITPGRYRLWVGNLPAGFYLRAVRFGNQEIANQPLDLTNGSAGQVEAILSRNAAAVAGSVYLDDPVKPFPGAIVFLLPREKTRAEDWHAYLWTRADDGNFAIHNVPPGEYLAFAWDDIDLTNNVVMDPTFIASLKTSGVPLSLAEGATADIKIPVALEH
jgi:hypothetical protein